MRVRVAAGELWTYPDVTALCGEPEFDRKTGPATLLNPQVAFEVLSPSTEAFDRGDKFTRYQLLDSLMEYVLVASERMRIEHFARQPDGTWRLSEYTEPQQTLMLPSLACELPVSEVYERIAFSPNPR